MGKSGAGKSTLLHILGTLDTPDKGEVKLDDVTISHLNRKEMAAYRGRSMGFVFQFHNLLPEFTALENVCLPGYIAKRNEKEVKQRATALLNRLGLGDRLEHKPSQMSGGEQQRAAVARALINDPAVIFADEPTGNLDSQSANLLHHLFVELRDEMNQTFVIVTHNTELAELTDRRLTLHDGRLVN